MKKKRELIFSLLVVITFSIFSTIQYMDNYSKFNLTITIGYIVGGCIYISLLVFIIINIKKEFKL